MKLTKTILSIALLADSANGSQQSRMWPGLRKQAPQQEQQPQDDQDDSVAVEAVPDATLPLASESSTEVPAAKQAGPDGYLPGVTNLLGGASATLKSITSQANVLQAQLVEKQQENQANMAKKKALYEGKLKLQESSNRNVEAENGKIEAEIQDLKSGNEKLRSRAKLLQQGNRVMRNQFQALDSKFALVNSFVKESLTDTDDSWVKELNVLKTAPPRRTAKFASKKVTRDTDEDDDDDKDDDKDDNEDSFVQMATKRTFLGSSEGAELEDDAPEQPAPVVDPSSLVAVLRAGVEQLSRQGHDSEHKLHAMFVSSLQSGKTRHEALKKKQQALVGQRTALQTLQQQLVAADAHLQSTKEQLEQHLRGLGMFAQRLAHLALAPVSEVSHLIDALPSKVVPVMPPPAAS